MMLASNAGGTSLPSASEMVAQTSKSQLLTLSLSGTSSMPSVAEKRHTPPTPTTRAKDNISPRRQAFAARELDPLLGNLSPMATIEALKASKVVDDNADSRHRLLAESIADVSQSERALGIRAAVAAKKLKEWFSEVHAWEWPKKFDPPSIEELREKARLSHHGSLGQALALDLSAAEDWDIEYWGSLPAKTVEEHEERLEDIQDEMEAFDLEELKSYVRKAHLIPNNDSSSSLASLQSIGAIAAAYNKLDDFTMIITATIMQALPYLSRLSSLIDRWSTRLAVLRRVPRFLIQLEGAQDAMEAANDAISGEKQSDLTRKACMTVKEILKTRTNVVAETLDSMLDLVEGHTDGLPDCWIDDMEAIETEYLDWVADAEGVVMANELRALKSACNTPQSEAPPPQFPNTLLPTIEEPENESSAETAESEGSKGHQAADQTKSGASASLGVSNDMLNVPIEDGSASDLSDMDYSDMEIITAGQIQYVNVSRDTSQGPSLRPSIMEISSKSPSHRSAKSSAMPSPWSGPPSSGNRSPKTNRDDYFKMPAVDQTLPPYEQADEADDEDTHDEDEDEVEHYGSGFDRHIATSEDLSDLQDYRRKSSSDDTNAHSFRTTTTFEHPGGRRSRASTVNTYTAWSDQSEPEVEGGLKSYGNASPSPTKQEFDESKRTSQPGQKHNRSVSTDAFFNSIVQPLSSPVLPIHKVLDEQQGESEDEYGQPWVLKQSLDIRPSLPNTPTSVKSLSLKSHKRSFSALSKLARSLSRSSSHQTSSKQQRQQPPPPPPLVLARPPSSRRPMSPLKPQTSSGPVLAPPRSSSIAPRPTTSPSNPHALPMRTNTAISLEEQLTERISSLLSNIPAPIQLLSGPETDAMPVPPTPTTPSSIGLRTALYSNPASPQAATPEAPVMKLVPAHSPAQPTIASRSAQSEVKLYHLTRNGSLPIKLYVRLVGEGGGRVMVRVGGGWSDLGEYLRDYASHHGRNATVGPDGSGAGFEVHDLPVAGSGSNYSTPHLREQMSKGSIKGSRPTTPSPASLPVYAKEYVSRARRHVSAGPYLNDAASGPVGARPSTAGAILRDDLEDPTSDGNESTYSAFIRREQALVYGGKPRKSLGSRANEPNPSYDNSSKYNKMSLRPSTPTQNPLGPAGPAGRPKDISPKKKAWVEGVLSQARKVSGGGGSGNNQAHRHQYGRSVDSSAFAQQDNATGTKRVFLKKASFSRKA